MERGARGDGLLDYAHEFNRVVVIGKLLFGVRNGQDFVLLFGFVDRSEVDFDTAEYAAADELRRFEINTGNVSAVESLQS